MSKYTAGPWQYIPSTEHHGPYVSNKEGYGDICDCYVMSNPTALSVRNGGDSKPIHMQPDCADANARLIAAAPALLEALQLFMHDWRGDQSPPRKVRIAQAAIKLATGE